MAILIQFIQFLLRLKAGVHKLWHASQEWFLYFSMLEKIKKENNISQHIQIIWNGTSVFMINFIGEQPHSFITILYVDVFAPVAQLGGCDRDLIVVQRQRTKDFITHNKSSSQRLMWVCTGLGRFTIPSAGATQRSYHGCMHMLLAILQESLGDSPLLQYMEVSLPFVQGETLPHPSSLLTANTT